MQDLPDQSLVPESVAVAADGTVCASTALGTLVVELSHDSGRPEVITSVQADIASSPRELARYPLRSFLALVLRAMRTPRMRGFERLASAMRVPQKLRRAQLLALAQFVRVNFDALMLLAHAPGRRRLA